MGASITGVDNIGISSGGDITPIPAAVGGAVIPAFTHTPDEVDTHHFIDGLTNLTSGFNVGVQNPAGSGLITAIADLGGAPNEVRITTNVAHGLAVGDLVNLVGVKDLDASYDGLYLVKNVPDTTNFDIESPYFLLDNPSFPASGYARHGDYLALTNTTGNTHTYRLSYDIRLRAGSANAVEPYFRFYARLSATFFSEIAQAKRTMPLNAAQDWVQIVGSALFTDGGETNARLYPYLLADVIQSVQVAEGSIYVERVR